MSGACCSPGFGEREPGPSRHPVGGSGVHAIEQADVPAGAFTMGDSFGDGRAGDGETYRHPVELDAFTIDATSVTNAATGQIQ